jgi:hypothetical protein
MHGAEPAYRTFISDIKVTQVHTGHMQGWYSGRCRNSGDNSGSICIYYHEKGILDMALLPLHALELAVINGQTNMHLALEIIK